MGIIRIYRSSATHWCKFGVHMLSCSHDRAVFPIFPNENSSISRKAVFSHCSGKNSSILRTSQCMNTKVAPVCCRGPVETYDPHIMGLLYIGVMLKLIKAKSTKVAHYTPGRGKLFRVITLLVGEKLCRVM